MKQCSGPWGMARLSRKDQRPCHLSLSDGPSEDSDLKDAYLIPRNIMAEPDYVEDDNPELIRPQKLVNPVKTSRNHQDLHRELLMNQKRYGGFLSRIFLWGLQLQRCLPFLMVFKAALFFLVSLSQGTPSPPHKVLSSAGMTLHSTELCPL